jgi:hypothetical protein
MHQAWTVDVRWWCRLNSRNNYIDFGVLGQSHIVAEPDLAVFDDAFRGAWQRRAAASGWRPR